MSVATITAALVLPNAGLVVLPQALTLTDAPARVRAMITLTVLHGAGCLKM
ncbi:MAG TPA: hypothetical protein VN602_13605 [Gemmatimonadaceae bacterium]|nr:hypothetical protein [Gemmatimonadaceae bacterium]